MMKKPTITTLMARMYDPIIARFLQEFIGVAINTAITAYYDYSDEHTFNKSVYM